MKLRNKKTGEIGEVQITEKHWGVVVGNATVSCGIEIYSSLKELNDDWEDYEEPKEHWCITMYGGITRIEDNEVLIDDLIEIGNYFNSKEDAYDALDKLKAWKRLKDKGLTFCAWKITEDGCSVDVETTLDAELVRAQQKYITDDLDLLFGGEHD